MTIPSKYRNNYLPIKYFLSSYRALSDGRDGIHHLTERLDSTTSYLSQWKVTWIGTCAVLRTAIDLFQADGKSCLAQSIRTEINAEWKTIGRRKDEHAIFWDFLKRERDNIVHEYEWRAYESWMKPDGTFRAANLSLMILDDDGARPILRMKDGVFKGRNSLELLKEGADWVEARIFTAIRRAGFDPEEKRNLFDFLPMPKVENGILTECTENKEKDSKS